MLQTQEICRNTVPPKLVREGGPPSASSRVPTSVMEGVDGGPGVSGSTGNLEEGKSRYCGTGATGRRTATQETPPMPTPLARWRPWVVADCTVGRELVCPKGLMCLRLQFLRRSLCAIDVTRAWVSKPVSIILSADPNWDSSPVKT